MSERPPATTPPGSGVNRRSVVAGAIALVLFALVAAGLLSLVVIARDGGLPGSGAAATDPADFAYAAIEPAPPLELTDQDGRPFALSGLLGRPVLVFFGYTHCPDVCPATIGTLNQALAEAGPGPRAVFVSIDPERDDPAELRLFLKYLPAVYAGLTGTADQVGRTADAWSVRYAKIDQGSPSGYAMAHTADVFLVDAQGLLRAHFPFGTAAEPIAASLRALLADTPAPPDGPVAQAPAGSLGTAPTPPAAASAAPTGPQAMPIGDLRASVVSTSVWAGGQSPVILAVSDAMGMPLDGSPAISVRVVGRDGRPVGADVPAVAIRPAGETQVSYVATIDIPQPGPWRLDLLGADGSTGSVVVDALDQGASARLGAPAPDIDTPTLDDVGGNLLAVSTLPQADRRLYQGSTADARAAGRPYVLVVDSARFKVSSACGRALSMIRFMLDRWPGVSFVHLEPFEYQIVTGEPVLSGDLVDPPLNRYSHALGLGDATWPATRMPWIFVVDATGIVRAKYTGIVGSADVDLILSLIAGEGVVEG